MANYTMHCTFEAPGAGASFEQQLRTLGGIMRLRVIGGSGTVTVTGTVRTDGGPADAVKALADETHGWWRANGTGPITLASWTASRRKVFAGRGMPDVVSGLGVSSWDDGDEGDDDGTAGVREPRRPRGGPPALGMELDLPGSPDYL